ncbi:DUF2510 domain-containing protein [Cellulomonas sp.]|uniref:DUF2510 domain-containing protein n=1 Tax=Cellulomonas sp. TaxID=40001 RepID=UPI001B203DAA|nr:DUF2510 domain-containing protein [Cellulomonas sp.]MBO9556350.1 DUF2510 domain-containing protein [Cellulomonas sp.]
MTQPSPPAGFYPDPSGAPQQRFWDGTAWTAHTQAYAPPVVDAPTTPTVPAAAPQGFRTPTGEVIGGTWGSILTTLTTPATQTSDARPHDQNLLGGGQDFYRAHQRGVDTAAGGALVAEGLLGLDGPGNARPGMGGALKGVVFGLLFAGIALVGALFVSSGDIDGAVRTTGTVVEVRESTSSDSRSCSLVLEYQVDGRTYTTGSGYGSSSLCGKSRGSVVTVQYDPANPRHANMPTPMGLRFVPWAFVAVGLVITVVSAVQVVLRAAALGTGGWLLWRGLRGRGSRQA